MSSRNWIYANKRKGLTETLKHSERAVLFRCTARTVSKRLSDYTVQ